MLYFTLLSMILTIALTLPLMTAPISLGIWIFFLAMFTAGLASTLSSTWFGLILFIIYIGGMLVMFSYFVAITPNQIIRPYLTYILTLLTFFIVFMYVFTMNLDTFSLNSLPTMPSTQSFTMLYTPSQAPMLLFLASLLLIALIFVVKIATRSGGPLRPFKPYV